MSDLYRFTILGCGSSPGVPRVGNDWGACDPQEPRNRRLRASLLIERIGAGGVTRVVVDTGPDFRQQMLAAGVPFAEGVVYTHPHADHIHGIDELRQFVINHKHRVRIYADAPTLERLKQGFGYCFETPPGSNYPPIVRENLIEPGQAFVIDGPGGPISLMPYAQIHGDIRSLGFRIGDFAYSSDVNAIPDESLPHLQGLAVLVVDALRPTPHASHFSVGQAVAFARSVGARRTILTHMHIELDYRTLERELPAGVEPGYDGLRIELPV